MFEIYLKQLQLSFIIIMDITAIINMTATIVILEMAEVIWLLMHLVIVIAGRV